MGFIRRQDFTGWLFVAGCASKQGLFHDRFDANVLLSVPREVTFFNITELGGRISLARVRDLQGAASARDVPLAWEDEFCLGTCPLVRRSTFQVRCTSWSQGLSVTTGGSGVVPLAGAVALRRDFGLITGQLPAGSRNLVSDVAGVTVGHYTNPGPNRRGVAIISPSKANIFRTKLPAAVAVGNGYTKTVGTIQIHELGQIETPIALTSTHAVAPVLQGLLDLVTSQYSDLASYDSISTVVGETNDWILNDLHTQSIKPADVKTAWDARTADFELGAVGAGAGTRSLTSKAALAAPPARFSSAIKLTQSEHSSKPTTAATSPFLASRWVSSLASLIHTCSMANTHPMGHA
jgi:Peptidase family S58